MSTPLNTAREQLQTAGFTHVEALFTERELQTVEHVLDRLVLQTDPSNAKRRRELSGDASGSAVRQPEFSKPTAAAPELRRSRVFAKCQDLAAGLLGGQAHYLFDHAIYKMPRSGAGTPWHQDQAYLGRTVQIQSVHFWIPLQETGTTNGCLRFVRGDDVAALQPHRRAHAANPHVLRTVLDYTQLAVDVPLRKGDVSIHTNLTVHASRANESDAIRKAWIIHFGDKSLWYKRFMQLKEAAGQLTTTFSR